ncbi:MAG: hypothetical protein JWM11_3200 [Planctomycetaceae bacterium]|nr:hypothetical protein [Planctomycetaceae bacterium]
MRESPKVTEWVVYETVTGPQAGMKSVCTAAEWKVIDGRDPNKNRIIRENISDENEAEKLARGTSGDLKARAKALRPTFE